MTQVELEKKIYENKLPAGTKNIVMIQCAGSRDDEQPYCSRICCSMAVKNALAIKKKIAGHECVCALPRRPDLRLPRTLLQAGPRSRRGLHPLHAGAGAGRLRERRTGVSLKSPDFPEPIAIETDLVVLSTGVEADRRTTSALGHAQGAAERRRLLCRSPHEAAAGDFATEGIFLCGLAHSPKFIDENISQARAAAARAATVLSKTHLDVSAQVSYVDQRSASPA